MLAPFLTHALACSEPVSSVAVEDVAAEPSYRPPAPIPATVDEMRTASLPRAVPTTPADLDALPCTEQVGQAGLQAAIDAARGGAVLCLTGTYRGAYTVPRRTDEGWIVIRTAAPLPPGRVHPSATSAMARLVSPNQASTITFEPYAARVMLLGIEITSDSALDQGPVALVQIGSSRETTVESLPTDVVLQQVYIHGWPNQHVRRAIAGNGGAQTLRDSWCDEIHAWGFDSQCWISWNSTGPVLIENNTLQAASENIMFGGADPNVPGLVTSDVTIRHNHIAKPLSWQSGRWNVKTLVETKSSARVLVEENVLEGAWADGQTGYAFVLKSTSQDGTCAPCGTSDWTIRRNLVRHTGAGFSIAGRADQNGPTATDSSNRRFEISENWIEPLNVPPFMGDGRPVIFLADNEDIEMRGNTFEDAPQVREAVLFDVSGRKNRAVRNLRLTTNVLPHGKYGVGTSGVGEGLMAWLAGALGTSTWTRNAFLGASNATYPIGTTWHSTLTSALGGAGVSRATIELGIAGVVVER